MKRNVTKIIYPSIVIGFFVLTSAYIKFAEPIFEITSEIMINRQTIALPKYLGEVGSNRWIWVRNGLATKESIISDKFLSHAIASIPELVNKTLSKDKQLKTLREQISVSFTGADVYSFAIRVKSKHPKSAVEISKMIINEIKRIEIAYPIKVYNETIKALIDDARILKTREKNLPPNLESSKRTLLSLNNEIDQIESTLHQLKIARLLMSSEGENRFTIIKQPLTPNDSIWPKPLLLYLITGIISVMVICSIEIYKRK